MFAAAGLILMLSSRGATISPLAFTPRAEVEHVVVRLGDVADVAALPAELRNRASVLPLMRFASGQDEIRTDTHRLAERARAQLPGLGPWLSAEGRFPVSIVRKSGRASAVRAVNTGCMRLLRSVPAGASPIEADVAPAPCDTSSVKDVFRYDRQTRAARVVRELTAGETAPALPDALLPTARPGDRLAVEARIGAVVVTRDVEAIQSGRPGQKIFVRTSDGIVFAAPAPEREP